MATQTPIFGFTKPNVNDFYDVNVQNRNWDILDEQLSGGKIHDVIRAASEAEFDQALLNIVNGMSSPSSKFVQVYSTTDSFLMGGRLIALITKSITDSELGTNATVEMFQTTIHGVLKMMKNILQNQVSPIEYVNPPMVMGEEYRTTERWTNKTVYTKLIHCGMLADGATINKPSDASMIVRHEMYCFTSAWIKLPIGSPALTGYYAYCYSSIDGDSISLKADTISDGFGHGSYTYCLQLWYTKD